MNLYLITKCIHIFGVCLMLGASFCNGLLHLLARRSTSTQVRHATLNNIVQINQIIMGPAFILLITSGLVMVYQAHITLSTTWLGLSLILTATLVVAYVWGYQIESKLEQITATAPQHQKGYLQLLNKALPIGGGASLVSLLVLYLMVFKPT